MAAIEIASTPFASDARLVMYHRFSDNLTDSGPNGYNLSGGPASYQTGVFGKAARYDSGNESQIAAASSPNIVRAVQANMSWFFKIKPVGTPSGQFGVIGFPNSGTDYFCIHTNGSTQKLRFTLNAGGGDPGRIDSSIALADGVWYTVCAINDWTNSKLKIWVDSTKDEKTPSLSAGTNTGPFYINGVNIAKGAFDIDELAVFNGALTDAEYAQIRDGTFDLGRAWEMMMMGVGR